MLYGLREYQILTRSGIPDGPLEQLAARVFDSSQTRGRVSSPFSPREYLAGSVRACLCAIYRSAKAAVLASLQPSRKPAWMAATSDSDIEEMILAEAKASSMTESLFRS